MLPAGGFAEPFGIDKSSRPWRQILPQAKFPRQLHLHPAVTYVHVSSLGCKHSFLGLQAFSTLCQSVDFFNILRREALASRRETYFGLYRASAISARISSSVSPSRNLRRATM